MMVVVFYKKHLNKNIHKYIGTSTEDRAKNIFGDDSQEIYIGIKSLKEHYTVSSKDIEIDKYIKKKFKNFEDYKEIFNEEQDSQSLKHPGQIRNLGIKRKNFQQQCGLIKKLLPFPSLSQLPQRFDPRFSRANIRPLFRFGWRF